MKIVMFYNETGSPKCEKYYSMIEENGIDLVRVLDSCTAEEQVEACKGADAVITSIKPFPREIVERLDGSVKAIVRLAMGYEIIDLEACSEQGIFVCNVPDYAMEEVAVHQAALMLATIRKVVFYDKKIREGKWQKFGYLDGYPARRISTLSVGLLGFGRIAKNVAKYMKAFGATVYAYDPFLPDSAFEELGVVRAAKKDDIFRNCDVISPNIPLMDSSFHIIDEEAISRMKDGVIIINTGRGPLVDQEALTRALQSGKVRAAGLDVYETEPFCDTENPLMKMENVVLTPHIAYQTEESFDELQYKAVLYAIQGAKGEVPDGAVNKNIEK